MERVDRKPPSFFALIFFVCLIWSLRFNFRLPSVRHHDSLVVQANHGPFMAIAPGSVRGPVSSVPHIPFSLLDLVKDDLTDTCVDGLVRVRDSNRHLLASDLLQNKNRRIPKVIHVTARSRCMPRVFRDSIDKWRFDNYTLLVHDDESVERLFQQFFPEFPELSKAVHCLLSGAGRADLWRALVLWEDGGIYTDFDSAPGKLFKNGNVIADNDDAFFVVEQSGILSQYFMASAPHHPLMYLLVQKIIGRLYNLNRVDHQYVPRSTGPGALKYAFLAFMDDAGENYYEGHGKCNDFQHNYSQVKAGIYTGWDNRSVRVVGKRIYPNLYVIRNSIEDKMSGYNAMNMTHFGDVQEVNALKKDETCFRRIYERDGWASRHEP